MIILQSQATTLNNDIWLHFFYDHMQVKTKNQIEDYFEQKLIIYDNYNYSIQQLCEFDSFFICIFYRLAFFMTKKNQQIKMWLTSYCVQVSFLIISF